MSSRKKKQAAADTYPNGLYEKLCRLRVGEIKARRYGKAFLKMILDHQKEHDEC